MEDSPKLFRLVLIVGWLRSYPKEWWRPDLIAGLTAAAVVIPKAMAYATIAGLPLVGLCRWSSMPYWGRPGRSLREGDLLPQRHRDRRAPVAHVGRHAGAGAGPARVDLRVGAPRSERAHPVDRHGWGDCGVGAAGLEKLGVETVGSVPRGFPTLAWPDLDLDAQMW